MLFPVVSYPAIIINIEFPTISVRVKPRKKIYYIANRTWTEVVHSRLSLLLLPGSFLRLMRARCRRNVGKGEPNTTQVATDYGSPVTTAGCWVGDFSIVPRMKHESWSLCPWKRHSMLISLWDKQAIFFPAQPDCETLQTELKRVVSGGVDRHIQRA